MVGRGFGFFCTLVMVLGACEDTPSKPGADDGIWVSALTGDDQNPGTRARPVRSITRGIELAMEHGGPVHVAQGEYTEHVEVVEGISLLGGHDCAVTPCQVERSPAQLVTTIRNPDTTEMHVPADVTRATSIDGFTIIGAPGSDERIDALEILGSPTITNNVIEAGGSTKGGEIGPPKGSAAISIASGAEPLIVGNHIRSKGPLSWAIVDGGRAEIRGNRVEVNGGDHVTPSAAITARGSTTIIDNEIIANATRGIVASGSMVTIDRNRVSNGGLAPTLIVDGGTAVVTNNVLAGGGIEVSNNGSVGPLVIHSNLIEAETAVALGPQSRASVRNNIMLLRGYSRVAISEAGDGSATLEAVENNVFWYADTPSDDNDLLWRHWDGGAYTDLTTIEQVNAVAGAANNLFVDPLVHNFHLQPGSPCIDAGTAEGAPAVDIDGDARPQGSGYDIGPDELAN